MSEGLGATFELLKTTKNEAANAVLLAALDSPRAEIQRAALAGILARRNLAGHREIVARFHALDDGSKDLLKKNARRFTLALRESVLSNDRQTCLNGCMAARMLREYDLVPPLLHALEDESNANSDLAGETLMGLIHLLCDDLSPGQGSDLRRDPEITSRQVLGALEGSVQRFGKHRRGEVLDAFLRLAPNDNLVLKQLLENPFDPAFRVLADLFVKSTQPSILRILVGFLDDPRAPSSVLGILGKRADREFVECLLRKIDERPSHAVAQNLKRMESLAWLKNNIALLDDLDEPLQRAAVQLAMGSAIPRPQAFSTIEHMLLRGKAAGRRAAALALEEFQGAEANALALKALDDSNPEVQAAVLQQLRRRGIPGALGRLVHSLDSSQIEVRRAARECLGEFSFAEFLKNFDMLTEEARQNSGELVKKVDPHLAPQLRAELSSRSRRRRLRGLAITQLLGVAAQVESGVLRLMHEDDHMIRAAAAAALGRCHSRASRDELLEALGDRSLTVRESAAKSLEQRGESLPAQPVASSAGSPEAL